MKLVKNHIDVGINTDRTEEQLAFWQREVGLPFEELLPVGPGLRQHRHGMNGSVFKLNSVRDALPPNPPAGYRELLIARAGLAAPVPLVDADGNRVVLVPPGFEGIEGIAVRLAVRDLEAHRRFYIGALELEETRPGVFRCGDSLLVCEADPGAAPDASRQGPGYRYITIQVWDCDAEHAGILARGGREGMAPVTLGSTARISFVRDPDGNWIEISQRATLTGALPG